ncbi:MAG TPA: transglutaminase domain-containing protein [Polyangia bacterium]|nr:transglutaminase domain-containing protein [Polyangia bacterium]
MSVRDSRDLGGESWVVVLLHGLALAVAAAASVSELSLPAGTLGAVLGTLGAVIVAGYVARSPVRLGTVWLVAAGAAGLGLGLGRWLVEGSFVPSLFGGARAMAAGDVVRFGLVSTALALALRTTTARWRPFAVVELMVVALALAGVVASHRDGAINHPRALSDWAWSTGRDPVPIFLWIGVATAVALAVALLSERRGRGLRVVLHLGVAGALAALVLFLAQSVRLFQPPRGEGLGSSNRKDDQRGQGGRVGGRGGGGGGGGGSSNQMNELEFKNDYSSSSQDAPVAVVLLHEDYSPPLGYYYFRQTAFSQFNGFRLVASTRDDVDRDIVRDFPSKSVEVPDAPETGAERAEVKTTVALLADHVHPFGLETPTAFAPRESPDPARFLRAYDVTSAALAVRYEDLLGKKPFANSWSEELKAAYTQMPDDARYRELADKIVEGTLRPEFRLDPFAQAIAISSWLSKNSVYSRKSQHAGATDPTGDFLFGDRVGYCVHFAHAAAFLLRARGLPARIAAGYIADEGRKGSGSSILLRQKDAHAWAELFLDGFGWIIVDVSPERTLDPPDTPPDQELQRLLGEMARGQRPKLVPAPGERPGLSAAEVARALAGILGALVALAYAVKIWRRVIPAVAGAPSIYRVAYRAALDRLAEAGWRRAEGETRERFAVRLGRVAPTWRDATRQHVGAAYGGRQLVPVAEMRRLAKQASAEARRHAPWWRVALGWLNPISWLWAR